MKLRFIQGFILANTLLLAGNGVFAAEVPFTGAFSHDEDLVFFKFQADGTSTVTVRSYGYGGGVTDNGSTVNPGGFDTLLTLYDNNGYLSALNQDNGGADLNDDGAGVNTDPATGSAYDSLYEGVLPAGTYWLALTEAPNFGPGYLGLHFSWDGMGDPTGTAPPTGIALNGHYGCAQGKFCDYDGNDRTGAWALDILGASNVEAQTRSQVLAQFPPPPDPNPPTIPEPGTLALFSLGLAGAFRFRPRRAAGR